jgi:hypothetical protein
LSGPSLAVFVSPHGFGHAARASAVMEALVRRADARFELYASTPRWFFDESVAGRYRMHELRTDVGFVQRSALELDLEATAAALDDFLPFDGGLVEGLALEVRRTGCRAVLCDIAPLGIAVAERAGVPSVLVENFTWPWLYEPLLEEAPGLAAASAELARWLGRATWHVQTEPVCASSPRAAIVVPPVSRPGRSPRDEVRRGLGIDADRPMVVVTMGGIPHVLPFLDRLRELPDVAFVVTGAAETLRMGNLHLFDNATRIYMPDFVRAADAVVAKLGYSTLAEVWRAGRPFAYVTRPDFRESPELAAWAAERLPGFAVEAAEFEAGGWVDRIPELLSAAAPGPRGEGGADDVARWLVDTLKL